VSCRRQSEVDVGKKLDDTPDGRRDRARLSNFRRHAKLSEVREYMYCKNVFSSYEDQASTRGSVSLRV
jgi:hypothetical protein